ncbi:YwbE family protein [Candidatus Parcubacteria bacterium]|nr:YwbE family protein [Candidatus Parcubacteria bacterium]
MNGQNRNNIKIGGEVEIVLKQDQRTGKLTSGRVADILTISSFHPRGIKVRLADGQVGRVQKIGLANKSKGSEVRQINVREL